MKENSKRVKEQSNSVVSQNQTLKSSDSQNMYSHRPIGISEIDQLYQSRDRLSDFSDRIGHIKFTNIRKDVISHCEKAYFTYLSHLTFYDIEKMVKNRIDKMIKNKRIKKNWSEQDIKILIWIVSKYTEFRDIQNIEKELDSSDWKYIASLIPGVQGENCMFKWLSLKKNKLSDNNWEENESNLLQKLVKQYNAYQRKLGDKDWGSISQQLYFLNKSHSKIYRCPKQCRQHWNCYLNPILKKGPWSKAEDLLLLNCVKDNNGCKKWAEIIELFNGRTENALKNRFTLIMEKEQKVSEKGNKASQLQLINQYLERIYVEQFVQQKDDQNKNNNIKSAPLEKKNIEQSKREIRVSLRRRQNLRSSTNFQKQLNFISVKSSQKEKKKSVKTDENIQQLPLIEAIQQVNLPREQISQPQHHYWLQSENKIFEQDSFPSPSTFPSEKDHMPELNKVRIIELTQEQVQNLKLSLLESNCDYIPCIIAENKLTKISY